MTSSTTARRHPGVPAPRLARAVVVTLLAPLALLLVTLGTAGAADAAAARAHVVSQVQAAPQPTVPDGTQGGNQGGRGGNRDADQGAGTDSLVIDVEGLTDKPSSSVTLLLTLTLLSLAPAILLTCTSFTKILVVLGLTRNALGLQQTPPNQVLAGLALFLSVFIMAPVLSQVNDDGLQPYLEGQKNAAAAYESGVEPLREFMLDQTGDEELALLTNVARRDLPANRAEVPMSTLVPAFIISELKQAFIIGFIIFIPFLVIDIVVSGALMALGMMMMPPVMVSLPFKLLLFVLVDGWALIITSLVQSYA
ncbi:MAG: flagellar biosynthetic protein FliP [Nocardioides sp.]|nr:flagellar biosynthetic protein FliP [Nocardioides sp.]